MKQAIILIGITLIILTFSSCGDLTEDLKETDPTSLIDPKDDGTIKDSDDNDE